MKNIFILSLACLCLLSACKKEKVIKDDKQTEKCSDFVVIGDQDAKITRSDSIISPPDRCDSFIFKVDIDFDGAPDIAVLGYYCYSPAGYWSNYRIKCLSEKVKVVQNETTLAPAILNSGDILSADLNWQSESMEIISTQRSNATVGGDDIHYKTGEWCEVSEKFIGIVVGNKDNPVYGWIKISPLVPSDNWITALKIHEVGAKKASYK